MNWLRRVSDENNVSYSQLFGDRGDEEDDGQSTPIYTSTPHDETPTGLGLTLAEDTNPRLLSRLKHGLNSSTLGSVFARSSSPSNHKSLLLKDDFAGAADIHTPPDSPIPTPRRLSGIKQVFSCSSRSYSHSRSPTDGSIKSTLSSSSSPFSSLRSKISSPSVSRHLAQPSTSSDLQSTPPLTPDTLADLASPTSAYSQPAHHRRSNSIQINDLDSHAGTGSQKNSKQKKGKNPAPPFPYETLIADISNSPPQLALPEEAVVNEDLEEWWGLEYTLELSKRDRRASETSTSTNGEHSKSRESWAAIHAQQPTVKNSLNRHGRRRTSSDFQEWQTWHDNLEKDEEDRRRQRTAEFMEECERMANLFVDELYARRALELYEDKLTDDEIRDAVKWVEYTSEHRKDFFTPPENRDLAWVLKGHRSIGSLRDLQDQSA